MTRNPFLYSEQIYWILKNFGWTWDMSSKGGSRYFCILGFTNTHAHSLCHLVFITKLFWNFQHRQIQYVIPKSIYKPSIYTIAILYFPSRCYTLTVFLCLFGDWRFKHFFLSSALHWRYCNELLSKSASRVDAVNTEINCENKLAKFVTFFRFFSALSV